MKVGTDEFCSKCMEWREFDENGKCKVCGKLIKSSEKSMEKDNYGDYKYEPPETEVDSEAEDF